MNIAVLISGNGSNLQAIIDAKQRGEIDSSINVVIANKKDAFGLKRAEAAQIPAVFIDPKQYKDREAYDQAIINILKEYNVEVVVLAGYMRILSKSFVHCYRGKILNIHPSLLPDFKGAHAIRDAFEAKVKKTGATVHFVIEDLDAGPIIIQQSVDVTDEDTLDTLESKIHAVEHIIYPQAIALFEQGKTIFRN